MKYLLRMAIAIVAFCVGVAGNSLVNGFGLFLIDRYETVSNIAIATLAWEERSLIGPQCHDCNDCHLLVTVSSDRTLYLNWDETGTLANPDELLDRLRAIFEARTQGRVYKPGMEATSDVPEEDRIEKTVYIKVPRGTSFGEVSDLIEELKAVGANPIGLVSAALVK